MKIEQVKEVINSVSFIVYGIIFALIGLYVLDTPNQKYFNFIWMGSLIIMNFLLILKKFECDGVGQFIMTCLMSPVIFSMAITSKLFSLSPYYKRKQVEELFNNF